MSQAASWAKPPTERFERSDVSEPSAQGIRAVLDTNVLVRGLTRATGPSRQILEVLVDTRAFELVTSTEILVELGEVLQRPAFRRHVEFNDFEIMLGARHLLKGGTAATCAGDGACDGVLDVRDNCPNIANPNQADTDHPAPAGLVGNARRPPRRAHREAS